MDVRSIDSLSNTYRMPESEPIREEVQTVNRVPEDKLNVSGQDKSNEEDPPLSEKEQQRRMDRLQETLKNHNVEISYNDEVNRYAIKVLDAESKEVVKEIPSEKTLEMFAKMLEIEGLLVDEKR